MRNFDKFCGCLIGGSAGDAVEFLYENQIFSMYGKEGIKEYTLKNGIARISDDTQMMLFTAEEFCCLQDNSSNYIDYIREAYKRWYRTQTETYPLSDKPDSLLLKTPELFSRRDPGMTCLSAIEHGANGTLDNHINNSKGCGEIMRVAPIGLFFADTDISYEESDMLAAKVASLTHGHDLGFITAAALAHIVRAVTESNILFKDAVNDSIVTIEKLFSNTKYIDEFTAIMLKAVKLAKTEEDDLNAIHQLGEGWVAEETLAIAVYCALKYENDFDMAIRTSVNHNGDSDSTGAVCGNILGAYLGYADIPQKYKENLELHDLIIEIADSLHNTKVRM